MRNLTSLQQIDIVDFRGASRVLELTANWDWDEAWNGIPKGTEVGNKLG